MKGKSYSSYGSTHTHTNTHTKARLAKIIRNDKKIAGGNTIPYLKLYYRALAIKCHAGKKGRQADGMDLLPETDTG